MLGEYQGGGILLHLNNNVTDSSGNSVSCTNSNVDYDGGKVGTYCAKNTNASGYIQIGSVYGDTAFFDGEFTLSFWIKSIYASCPYYATMFSKITSGGERIYIGRYHDDQRCYIQFITGGSTAGRIFTTDEINLFDDKWHMLTITRKSTNVIKFFDNGNEFYTVTTSANFNQDVLAHLFMYEDRNNFIGHIDEFILENKGWTDAQVKKNYTHALGRFNN